MFQVCACLAAGGYTAGEVVSFGFPRPTGTAFLPALRATYERFGAGDATATFDQVLANRFLREEARYGIVFDRLRVAHFASTCLQANGGAPSRVDGRDRFGEVQAWVETTLEIPGLVESA